MKLSLNCWPVAKKQEASWHFWGWNNEDSQAKWSYKKRNVSNQFYSCEKSFKNEPVCLQPHSTIRCKAEMCWPAHHSFCDPFKGWSELFFPLLLSNVAQGVPHKSRIPTPCFCELGQSLRYLGRGMSRCQSQKPKSRNFKYNVWKRLHIERDGKESGVDITHWKENWT